MSEPTKPTTNSTLTTVFTLAPRPGTSVAKSGATLRPNRPGYASHTNATSMTARSNGAKNWSHPHWNGGFASNVRCSRSSTNGSMNAIVP